MEKTKELHPGIAPEDPQEEIAGLEEAIEATKKRIEEYGTNNGDVSEFEKNLRGLESRLDAAKERLKKKV